MSESAVVPPHEVPAQAVVLFDGDCVVCGAWVNFLLPRDRNARLRFGTLQSPDAQELLQTVDAPDPLPDAVILVEGDRVSVASTAALRVMGYLPAAWPMLRVFLVVPRVVRDGIYRWFARRRYRMFGKREACYLPAPADRGRFL